MIEEAFVTEHWLYTGLPEYLWNESVCFNNTSLLYVVVFNSVLLNGGKQLKALKEAWEQFCSSSPPQGV